MLDKNKMRGKKMNSKKILTFVLAMVMFIGCLPLNPIATYAEGDVAINETNFPDENFRNYVSSQLDTNHNGFLSQEECNKVEKIDISQSVYTEDNSKKVKSLKGIEHFKNLDELDCKRNQLKSLDVSKNTVLTKLKCDKNQLTSLDVSNNTALTELNCSENSLTSLDVSKNIALSELDCSVNQLTSLDVRGDTALKKLYCDYNKLTNLDLSENTALTELDCKKNQLTSLDVSKNTALIELICDNNQLTSLDVSNNTVLSKLYCFENQLTSLDVINNTALTELWCSNNQLKSLDVSKNTALIELICDNNQLTNLDVRKNTALIELICDNNQLTSLDVSKNTELTKVNFSNNQLTNLDVRENTALFELKCDNNQLTNLDLSKNTAIQALGCINNDLTNLDLSKITNLCYLGSRNNPLTYVKLHEGNPYDNLLEELSPVTYTLRVTEGSSKILFTALPQGFDSSRIQPGKLTGVKLEKDGFTWDKSTNPIIFKYKLWDKPETNDAELREADDKESGFEYAVLRVLILEVVGPVDPNKVPNPNPDKYWTVKFESEDTSKGTVVAENTFYVLKTANKTLADLASKAPEVTAKTGFKFTGWNPALDANTSINGNLTVNATFEEVTPTPAPIEYKRDHTPSIPVIVNVAKTMKLNVKLIIGSKEMIKSVDGVEEKIMMDVAPFIENGRTMLPIRFVAEGLGFNVRWDKDSRTVILIDKENVVKIPVDTNKIIVNEKEYTSDVKPVIKNDRTMLPIANIARALGLKDGKDIHWNEGTKEVIITREIVK